MVSTAARLVIAVGACLQIALPAKAATFRTLYTFQGGSDGLYPTGIPIVQGQTLYGVTQAGGSTDCAKAGCGTIYAIDTNTGIETVLFRFLEDKANQNTGRIPSGSLSMVGTKLFGAVQRIGTKSRARGGVFSFDVSTSAETIVYEFTRDQIQNRALVQGGFTLKDGLLYGVSLYGPSNAGFLYSLDPSTGVVSVMYGFPFDTQPNSPLAVVGDEFFGTSQTYMFGLDTTTDTASVLYRFTKLKGGYAPVGNLTQVGDKLYGAAYAGGRQSCHGLEHYSCGVLFSYSLTTQTYAVEHYFNGTEGAAPGAGLTLLNNVLYGTTDTGGANNAGTVYSFDPSTKQYELLYSIPATAVSKQVSGLSTDSNSLYGTYGNANGQAVVFSYTP